MRHIAVRGRKVLTRLWLILLVFGLSAQAQSWTGVLSRNRAIDWSHAGLPSALPDGEVTPNPWTPPIRTQCGPTLTPSGGDDSTQITNAFNGVGSFSSCTPPYIVLLGSGNFQINSSLFLGGNSTRNNITLRGSGPINTTVTENSSANFQVGSCCVGGGKGALSSAAANYTVGQTTFFLQNVTGGNPFVGAIAHFIQCDNGFTNSSSGQPLGTCTGAAADTGSVFHCSDTLCASNGNFDTSRQQEVQLVRITSATNTSGTNWTVTTSPGLYMSDWTFSQGATLGWDNQLSYTSVGIGIENLTFGLLNGNNCCLSMGNGGYASWLKGVREMGVNINTAIMTVQECSHCLVSNNYFFSNDPLNFYAPFDGSTLKDGFSADTLILNNIIVGQVSDDAGNHQGVVYAYNYNRESSSGGDYQATLFEHAPGTNLMLRESNQWGRTNDDDTNGTHNLDTDFRNWWNCADAPYDLGITVGGGLQVGSWSRFENAIGNAIGFGQPNYPTPKCPTYQGTATDGNIWNLNGGPASDTSGLTVASLMRWGNVSNVTQATDTPANSGIRFVSGEVPTSTVMPSSTYPNAVPYQNSVPANNNLPCSFFLQGSSTTCTTKYSGGTGLSWWKVCDTWTTFPTSCAHFTIPPFPAIGPDVLAANGAPLNYANDLPAAVAWKNLPIDTTYQQSFTITASSWSSGTETLTVTLPVGHPEGGFQLSGVAGACIPTSGFSFTGRPDGELIVTASSSTTVSYALASNPGTACTGTLKWPDIRKFDERVYQLDSGLGGGAVMAGLVGTVIH